MTLSLFLREAWPILEPAARYVHGWHIDAIAEHLEAVSRGEIRNLVINMPPRHMKSLAVSVFWPVWEWTFQPGTQWLFASYAASLSIRDSLKCRRLIQSPWFQQRFGDVFQLTGDQNAKQRFENDRSGYRLATSVGGAATGEGGTRIVCDDPHNVTEAESEATREGVLTWWDESMSSRLNDPRTGSKVIVMQRIHTRDLAGHALARGYELLCLPEEYESGRQHVTAIGWADPRTADGELLWPERVGAAEVATLKTELGSYAYAGQYQQRPAPRGGGVFRGERIGIVDAVPARLTLVRYWDKAATAGGGAFSCGVLMGRASNGQFYVVDVARGQWSALDRNSAIRQHAALDGKSVPVWVEQEPGSGGKESAQLSVKELAGWSARVERVTGDKASRAGPFAAQVEAGNVFLLRGDWNQAYLDELAGFPTARYKDQVDASSGAFNKLAGLRPFVAALGGESRLAAAYQRQAPANGVRSPVMRPASAATAPHPVLVGAGGPLRTGVARTIRPAAVYRPR